MQTMLLPLLLFLSYSKSPNDNKVLLISLDGFRWDYLDLCKEFGFPTPNFDRLVKMGVSLTKGGTTNVFPTQTLPNHFSLITGNYAESHGVIANSFYDSKVNKSYPNNYAWKYWYKDAMAIWTVNQHQGGKSGCYGWPGADVDPSISCSYNSHNYYDGLYGDTLGEAVDTVFKWILGEEESVNLGILYYYEPDESGHHYGISAETFKMVTKLDVGIGVLLDYMARAAKVGINLNVMLTADHGMADTPNDPGLIFTLDKIVDHDDYFCYECALSPFALIYPREGKAQSVYNRLKDHDPNLKVFWREDVPEDYHYSASERIPPIVLAAVFPYIIADSMNLSNRAGQHGYQRHLPQMHPIFIAAGNAFKSDYVAQSFESVDIFPMICHLLGLHSPPVNGSFDRIRHILRNPRPSDSTPDDSPLYRIVRAVVKLLIATFKHED